MRFLSLLSCLTLPVIFLYPHALLRETYLNYLYILFCGTLVFLWTRRTGGEFASVRFFGWLFVVNLLGNTLSLLMEKIDPSQFLQGNAVPLCSLVLSYLVCVTATSAAGGRLKFWQKSAVMTAVVVIVIICLDGVFAPGWIYETFYAVDESQIYAGTWLHRAMGTLLSPVMAGMFCALIITCFFARSAYVKLKYPAVAFLGLSFLALILTVSRTYFFALGFMMIFYLLFIRFNLRLVGMLGLIILIVVCLKLDAISGVFENLSTRNEQFDSGVFEGTGRLDAIRETIKYKFDWRCFIWGIGGAQYSIIENRFSLAHNGILSILLPNGLCGITLYCIMYYRNIKRYYRAKKDKFIDKNHLSFYLFVYLWLILSLGTFLSADVPMSMFWLLSLSFILSFSDSLLYQSKYIKNGVGIRFGA